MKYKVGDKVRIKRDLVVDCTYGGDTYVKEMDVMAKDNDYVLTIGKLDYGIGEYVMDEDKHDDLWYWTDAMIEGLAEKKDIKDMKYKVGDKVKIRRDLVVGRTYGDNSYVDRMDKIVRKHDYVLTIENYSCDNTQYRVEEESTTYNWTDEMIEGLAEKVDLADREKFEECMKKLSSLSADNSVWQAFNYIVTTEPHEKSYDDKLKIISDFLFAKKMTKAEIEKELGYAFELVEGE